MAQHKDGGDSIHYWNRREAREEIEEVYGDAFVRWIYGTKPGQSLAEWVFSRAFLSEAYGVYQSSKWSSHKVQPFIEKFKIPMQEFEEGPYLSFNKFFIRKFRPEAREFVQTPHQMPAFAEARYFAFEKVLPGQEFPLKGKALSASAILGGDQRAARFQEGPLLLARLCPTDYHRFHFPDSGRVVESYSIHGKLHSVNPIALLYRNEILSTNERQVTILETQNFGQIAFVEVGALCVGKIVQTYPSKEKFKRGDEKGYFLFGGSTVIVMGEPGVWKPDPDLLEQTARGRETLVHLGESVAAKTK